MESMLIRDRYKVIKVFQVRENYAAVEAVDIRDRERPGRILNLYEGPLLHQYGPVYMELDPKECPLFREFFLEGSTLAAVFDNVEGAPIDRVFFAGDKWDWRKRLDAADSLLREAMTLTNLPPEVSCAALLSENVRVDPAKKKTRLRFLIAPVEGAEGLNGREAALLAGDQVRKIFPRRWTSQRAELRFLDRVERGEDKTLPALYAGWRAARGDIAAEYEKWESNGLSARIVMLAKQWLHLAGKWFSGAIGRL